MTKNSVYWLGSCCLCHHKQMTTIPFSSLLFFSWFMLEFMITFRYFISNSNKIDISIHADRYLALAFSLHPFQYENTNIESEFDVALHISPHFIQSKTNHRKFAPKKSIWLINLMIAIIIGFYVLLIWRLSMERNIRMLYIDLWNNVIVTFQNEMSIPIRVKKKELWATVKRAMQQNKTKTYRQLQIAMERKESDAPP